MSEPVKMSEDKLPAGWLKMPEEPPAPEKSAAAGTGSVTWEQVIAALEEKLDLPDYMMLSNQENLSGKLEEGGLALYPKNDTVRRMLDAGRLELIRRTAEQLTGANTPVTIAAPREEGGGRFDQLDSLFGKFPF